MDCIGFAMHQFGCSHDVRTEGLPDRLVSKADAENRDFSRKVLNALYTNTRFGRGAGAWRDMSRCGGFSISLSEIHHYDGLGFSYSSISPSR